MSWINSPIIHQLPKRFACSDGAEYEVLPTGAIKQTNAQPFLYDAKYCATYDTPEYVRQSELLQALRLGFAQSAHGSPIKSLIDVGYGNGAFMKFVAQLVPNVMGIDVTDVPVPEGCQKIEDFVKCDVITFHDCLEHFHDLDFIEGIPCKTLVISLPNCEYHVNGVEWFEKWHHRKKNEHVYHFNQHSISHKMKQYGWNMITFSNHEDLVRKRDNDWNILSAAFKRANEPWFLFGSEHKTILEDRKRRV